MPIKLKIEFLHRNLRRSIRSSFRISNCRVTSRPRRIRRTTCVPLLIVRWTGCARGLIKTQLAAALYKSAPRAQRFVLRDGDFFAAVAVCAANCASRFSLYGVTVPIIRFPYLRSSNSLYVLGLPLSA